MRTNFIPALLFTLLIGSLTIPSCTKEYIEDINGVCFERDVLPVFVSNCTESGCHNNISKAEGYDLTSYESIISRGIVPGNYRKSTIYQSIVVPFGESIMPPPPHERLTDEQITNIALWIEQGAHNTTCQGTACDTLNMSYATHIKPILENYCNGCHSGSAPSGDIDYSSYNGVKASADSGKLVGSISHSNGYSPMPQGGNKLSSCNIARIEAWINAGAPNN